MMEQNDFQAVIDKVVAAHEAGTDTVELSVTEVEGLLSTIGEIDGHLSTAQQALTFALQTAERAFEEMVAQVVQLIQLRDHGKIRRIRGLAGQGMQRLVSGVQLFVASQIIELQNRVSTGADFDVVTGDDQQVA